MKMKKAQDANFGENYNNVEQIKMSKMKNKKVGEKKNNFDLTQIRNITKSVKKELNECIND